MACAKKCDRCGKLYEQYNSKNDKKNPNGIMVLNLDSQRRYFTHNALDLCPDCMKEFQDWLREVKQMERLTERYDITPDGESDVWVKQHDYISAARKLCDYEDLEEQGLLVRLPVPLGSKVYWISTRDKQNSIIFEKIFVLGMLYFWDSTVFATREEAEKKLEEMKNNGE